MQHSTYKTRLFRRLTDTCASLPDAVLLTAFSRFPAEHAQLLLSLLPMNTIARLPYLIDTSFFESLPTKELSDTQSTRIATQLLEYFNDLCFNESSNAEPLPSSNDVDRSTTSLKVLDFVARRMGRLTVKP